MVKCWYKEMEARMHEGAKRRTKHGQRTFAYYVVQGGVLLRRKKSTKAGSDPDTSDSIWIASFLAMTATRFVIARPRRKNAFFKHAEIDEFTKLVIGRRNDEAIQKKTTKLYQINNEEKNSNKFKIS